MRAIFLYHSFLNAYSHLSSFWLIKIKGSNFILLIIIWFLSVSFSISLLTSLRFIFHCLLGFIPILICSVRGFLATIYIYFYKRRYNKERQSVKFSRDNLVVWVDTPCVGLATFTVGSNLRFAGYHGGNDMN